MRNFLFLFLISICISAFSQESVPLWNKADKVAKWKQSIMYACLPEKPDTAGISVIICPGGSYYWLDMYNEGFTVAKYLNSKGITAFVLHYRTARNGVRFPAAIQDLQQAIQIVKQNAGQYGINPEKVGVMGFSAGGHLAGVAAEYFGLNYDFKNDFYDLYENKNQNNQNNHAKIKVQTTKPYFAAMIYPVITMSDEEIVHKKSRQNLLGCKPVKFLKLNRFKELTAMMSLEKNVRPDMPPIFLLHLTGDKTVDFRNSVIFDKALTDNKIRHKFLLIDESGHWGHGFGIQPVGKATGWIDEFVEWVKAIKNVK